MNNTASKVNISTATVEVCAECDQPYTATRPTFTIEQIVAHGLGRESVEASITIGCGCDETRTWERARADWSANIDPSEIVFLGEDNHVYLAVTA